jgi:hypothetical protein
MRKSGGRLSALRGIAVQCAPKRRGCKFARGDSAEDGESCRNEIPTAWALRWCNASDNDLESRFPACAKETLWLSRPARLGSSPVIYSSRLYQTAARPTGDDGG